MGWLLHLQATLADGLCLGFPVGYTGSQAEVACVGSGHPGHPTSTETCTNDSASYRIPILLRLPLYCSEVTVIFL